MPIWFTCPHCGTQTDVAEEFAGQSGPCAYCGQQITIPPREIAPGDTLAAGRSQGPGMWIAVTVAILAVVLLCGALVVALLLPAFSTSREAARRAVCLNNLKQIGLAMQMYHEEHGTFPPAYVADENGKPMHSWRVLLLPYLEQDGLHAMYDFDEPWDSPENQAVAQMMPDVYRCPSNSPSGGSETGYVVIVGPGTVFDGAKTTSLDKISASDGASNTVLVMEVAGATPWLEPRDYDPDLPDGGRPANRSSRGAKHPGGVNVLFCDGSVRSIHSPLSRQVLKEAATVAGGEAVFLDD